MATERSLKVNSQISSDVYLYIKSEPFDLGIIPVSLPSKLTHHNLRKLFAYAKNKGKSGYPRVTYAIWKHVACNKLQIEEDLAWLYFYTCEILTEQHSELHSKSDNAVASGKNDNEVDLLKAERTVDLLKFILFLYVQRAHVVSLKSPIVTGDEYPAKTRSQDLEGRGAIGAKSIDEHSQLSFILSNLSEILDLIVEPESYSDDNDTLLSVEAVNRLSYLVGATSDGLDILNLDEIACLQKNTQKSGFSKISQMFSYRRFQCWLVSNLKANPFGISSCLLYGQKLCGRGYSCGGESLNVSLNTSLSEETFHQSRAYMSWQKLQANLVKDTDRISSLKSSQASYVNRIFTNDNFAPECSRLILCNQICKRTVARNGDPLSNSTVKIHRCQNSYLYLMSNLRSVIVEKCHNSTIFVGAVETVVNLVACENMHFIGMTKLLIINSCRNSSFQICSPSKPVIVGRSVNLKFAPYYTYYPDLEKDMITTGLLPEPNYWDAPLLLGVKQSDCTSVWKEYPPDEFQKFVIPFDMDGDTEICPIHLPDMYQEALTKRAQRIDQWHKLIRESGLKKPQRTQLQSFVNDKFQQWLVDTGFSYLLESLAPPIPPVSPR